MTDVSTPPRSGRWVKIALVASLCLNVLVIGVAGGFLLKHRDGPRGDRIDRIVRYLPEARRDEARSMLEARLPEYEALRDQSREARRESMALLAADPLDEAALRAALTRARAFSGQRRAMLEDAMMDFAVTLSAEERREMVEQMNRRWERRERWRGERKNR
jgi:uncharacterized membrane protein